MSPTDSLLTRRALLAAMGLGPAAFLLPSLVPRSARADLPGVPRRIIFFYGSGSLEGPATDLKANWRPVAPAGATAPTETAWDLAPMHRALAPFKDQLIYLDGIGMVSEEIDATEHGNAHDQGAKHALAAVDGAGPALPGGPSIDQFIARRLNTPAPVTRFPSLQVCADGWNNELTLIADASASDRGARLPMTWDPRNLYDRLFPGGSADTTAAMRAAAQRRSVLDLVAADFGTTGARLGRDDRARLDAHLALLRDLESRIALANTCVAPPRTDLTAMYGPTDFARYDPATPSVFAHNWTLCRDLHTRLITLALGCDLTRVVFFKVGYAPDGLIGYTTGLASSMDAHDLTHKVNNPRDPAAANPDAVRPVRRACELECEALAQLLGALRAVPQSDGRTLLDHTLVLWCGQIGYGSHNLAQLPWVIAGGGGDYLRLGRYLRLPANPRSMRGAPHNDLFVSLANAMGLSDVTTFGNPMCCNGPLAGLRT